MVVATSNNVFNNIVNILLTLGDNMTLLYNVFLVCASLYRVAYVCLLCCIFALLVLLCISIVCWYRNVLHCIVLYCIVLYCIV